MIDRYDIRKVLFEDLQHELEQKLLSRFPDSDYIKVEGIIEDIFDKVYDELESRELVLVKDDDLSCMEYDYEEACDRLWSIRQLAKDGRDSIYCDNSGITSEDIDEAVSSFEDIIYEVER